METYSRILLCYDSTAEGRRALRQGADLAQKLGTEVHLLAIAGGTTAVIADGVSGAIVTLPEDGNAAKKLLEDGVERLKARGLVATGHLALGDAITEIPAAARELNIDLIVIGHKRRSALARWWAGPGDTRLLDLVDCSILVSIDPTDTGEDTAK